MKNFLWILLAVAGFGCSTPSTDTKPVDSPTEQKTTLPDPFSTQSLDIDFEGRSEDGIFKKVLFEDPSLKIVQLTLSGGTVLPDHATKFAVAVKAVQGSGTARVDGKEYPLDNGQMVVLPPGALHSIVPSDDAMLLIVFHFRR